MGRRSGRDWSFSTPQYPFFRFRWYHREQVAVMVQAMEVCFVETCPTDYDRSMATCVPTIWAVDLFCYYGNTGADFLPSTQNSVYNVCGDDDGLFGIDLTTDLFAVRYLSSNGEKFYRFKPFFRRRCRIGMFVRTRATDPVGCINSLFDFRS